MTISKPPENTTACTRDDVTISCGYRHRYFSQHYSTYVYPVVWIINGTSFNQSEIENSPLYRLNNPTYTSQLSLTVFSINHTTTFRCIVQSTPDATVSTLGTVTVTDGMLVIVDTYIAMC